MVPDTDGEFKVWRTARKNEFTHGGKSYFLPGNWVFVPSGDPGLTRKIKSSSPYWVVVHRRKNRIEAVGLVADAAIVDSARAELEKLRSTPEYLKKMASAKRSRERKQAEYEKLFFQAVVDFLAFPAVYERMANVIAQEVTEHAVPVGSGTVARTGTIPLPQRAEAAVIAWMRHRTTIYDHMIIPREKGERRFVRKMLAARSRALLDIYRRGEPVPPECPLFGAVSGKLLTAPPQLRTE